MATLEFYDMIIGYMIVVCLQNQIRLHAQSDNFSVGAKQEGLASSCLFTISRENSIELHFHSIEMTLDTRRALSFMNLLQFQNFFPLKSKCQIVSSITC